VPMLPFCMLSTRMQLQGAATGLLMLMLLRHKGNAFLPTEVQAAGSKQVSLA
jgi:hypothetical protein